MTLSFKNKTRKNKNKRFLPEKGKKRLKIISMQISIKNYLKILKKHSRLKINLFIPDKVIYFHRRRTSLRKAS